MNLNTDALQQAHQLALNSGKVEPKRLARALELIPKVNKTFTHVYTDHSRIEEYWIPGSAHTGYVVTVRNRKSVSGCTCKDSQERQITYCKHRLAVMLIVRADEIMPGSVQADPVPSPVADSTYRSRMVAALWPDSD